MASSADDALIGSVILASFVFRLFRHGSFS